jgi:hypothetical protein
MRFSFDGSSVGLHSGWQAAEKLCLLLILGGAALFQCCDSWPVFNAGFSR